jgi:hypothetical protein
VIVRSGQQRSFRLAAGLADGSILDLPVSLDPTLIGSGPTPMVLDGSLGISTAPVPGVAPAQPAAQTPVPMQPSAGSLILAPSGSPVTDPMTGLTFPANNAAAEQYTQNVGPSNCSWWDVLMRNLDTNGVPCTGITGNGSGAGSKPNPSGGVPWYVWLGLGAAGIGLLMAAVKA